MKIERVIVVVLVALCGCQSYHPLRVDIEDDLRNWQVSGLPVVDVKGESKFCLDDGVDLEEAQGIALVYNWELRCKRSSLAVSLAGVKYGGLWDDPVFGFDTKRILNSVKKPWIFGNSFQVTVPVNGVKGLQKEVAKRGRLVAFAELEVAKWECLADLRRAWYEWSALSVEVAIRRNYLAIISKVLGRAKRLVVSNELQLVDLRLFQIEASSQKAKLQRTVLELAGKRLHILQLLGLSSECPLRLIANFEVVEISDVQFSKIVSSHPLLLLQRLRLDESEEVLRREIRKQYPDLQIGLLNEYEDGNGKLGANVGLSLPLWNRNRQAIAEARARRLVMKRELQNRVCSLSNSLAIIKSGYELNHGYRLELEGQVLPLVERQLADISKLLQLGEVNLLLLFEALNGSLETKLEILQAHKKEVISANDYFMNVKANFWYK